MFGWVEVIFVLNPLENVLILAFSLQDATITAMIGS